MSTTLIYSEECEHQYYYEKMSEWLENLHSLSIFENVFRDHRITAHQTIPNQNMA